MVENALSPAALALVLSGALIIVRPGFVPLDEAPFWCCWRAVGVAILVIIVKMLRRTDLSLTITLYMGMFTTPVARCLRVPVWRDPSLAELGWLVAIGALTIVVNMCFAQAATEADAMTLMPFDEVPEV
jgi:hypothetical protein